MFSHQYINAAEKILAAQIGYAYTTKLPSRKTWDRLGIPYDSSTANAEYPLYGIEIEVEGVNENLPWDNVDGIWHPKEDGSLREFGREYTSLPMPKSFIVPAVQLLREHLVHWKMSHRCSTHVHVDVRYLTLAQALRMVLIYALVEPLLFKYCKDRRDNNFCVGLENTDDLHSMLETIVHAGHADPHLNKYSALNILPSFPNLADVPLYGTFEFRHLHGTLDVAEIMQWVDFLHRIRMSAVKLESKWLFERIAQMNIDSSYLYVLHRIFEEHTDALLKDTPMQDLPSLLEKHVSRVKQSIVLNPLAQRFALIEPSNPSDYLEMLRKIYKPKKGSIQMAHSVAWTDIIIDPPSPSGV